MKRALIAAGILIVMCISFPFFLIQIRDAYSELQTLADQTARDAAGDDWESTFSSAEKLGDAWNRRKDLLLRFLGHDQTDPVEISIARVNELVRQKNSSDLLVELSELSINIRRIWSSVALTIENMF